VSSAAGSGSVALESTNTRNIAPPHHSGGLLDRTSGNSGASIPGLSEENDSSAHLMQNMNDRVLVIALFGRLYGRVRIPV
jgi:hypothetical protein